MITASEARANAKLAMKKREEDLLYSANCWIENVLNYKIIDASKKGETSLQEEMFAYATEEETALVAKCAVRELVERYGFKAELVGSVVKVSWESEEDTVPWAVNA